MIPVQDHIQIPAKTIQARRVAWNQILHRCCVGLLPLILVVSHAAAQSCIPKAPGVPGHYYEPPNWLGTAPMDSTVDDPRWTGALSQTYGVGTGMEAEFRALYAIDGSGNKTLYLSWYVLYDASLNNNLDRLYVGFKPVTGDPIIIRVAAYSSSTADRKDQATGGIVAMTRDPGTGHGTPLSPTPAWLNSTRAWLVRGPSNSWAIQMKVPINSTNADLGVNIADTFKMWYSIYVFTPTHVDATGAAGGLIRHTWPRTGAEITQDSENIYPAPAAWDDFHLSTGAADPFCTSLNGISLDVLDVGTTNPSQQTILYRASPAPPPRPVNTIFARPYNGMTTAIPVGGITARFRLANWGSVVADPSAPWTDIPGGGAVSNTAVIPASTRADVTNISFNWTLDDADIAPYLAGKPSDQCILVDLTGPGLVFLNSSVRRNVFVVPASRFAKKAEINIVGLSPIPGGGSKRDVYLGVETSNMPAKAETEQATSYPDVSARTNVPTLAARSSDRKQMSLRDLVASGNISVEDLAKTVPTYRVHVYHDSGIRIVEGGQKYAVLAPQVSFGYFVDHQGTLTGWNHGLEGEGLEEIIPDFYKLLVPNNGSAIVTTTIEAVEFKRYVLSLLAGVSIPQGSFANGVDPGFAGTISFEYRINPTISALVAYTHHQFKAKAAGGSDVSVNQTSVQAKYYVPSRLPFDVFVNAGGSSYAFSPGTTKVGFNVGLEGQYAISSSFGLIATYNLNSIPSSGTTMTFSSIQGGIYFVF